MGVKKKDISTDLIELIKNQEVTLRVWLITCKSKEEFWAQSSKFFSGFSSAIISTVAFIIGAMVTVTNQSMNPQSLMSRTTMDSWARLIVHLGSILLVANSLPFIISLIMQKISSPWVERKNAIEQALEYQSAHK